MAGQKIYANLGDPVTVRLDQGVVKIIDQAARITTVAPTRKDVIRLLLHYWAWATPEEDRVNTLVKAWAFCVVRERGISAASHEGGGSEAVLRELAKAAQELIANDSRIRALAEAGATLEQAAQQVERDHGRKRKRKST